MLKCLSFSLGSSFFSDRSNVLFSYHWNRFLRKGSKRSTARGIPSRWDSFCRPFRLTVLATFGDAVISAIVIHQSWTNLW